MAYLLFHLFHSITVYQQRKIRSMDETVNKKYNDFHYILYISNTKNDKHFRKANTCICKIIPNDMFGQGISQILNLKTHNRKTSADYVTLHLQQTLMR